MIKFKLIDENNADKSYTINIDFIDDVSFDDWCDSNDAFDNFMLEMETGHDKWNGVHDGSSDIDDDGIICIIYSSYEIEDFTTAIEMWKNFFKKHGKFKQNTL